MPALLTKDDLRGIIPPVVSPFTADEELDIPAFRAEIQYQLSLNGVRGLTIGGSTGEGHALEADELGTLVKVAVDSKSRAEVMQITDIFRAKIVDVQARSLTIEITGDEGKVEKLLSLLKPFGIMELTRTGKVALPRS